MSAVSESKKPRLEVLDLKAGLVVHVVELRNTEKWFVQRVLSGLLRNLNTNKYAVREVDCG